MTSFNFIESQRKPSLFSLMLVTSCPMSSGYFYWVADTMSQDGGTRDLKKECVLVAIGLLNNNNLNYLFINYIDCALIVDDDCI